MHSRFAALLLLLLPLVSARPASLSRRDLRLRSRAHPNPLRRSTIAERSTALSARQTGCLTVDCTSTSDEAGVSAFNACSSTDTACFCTALGSLSPGCLSCALSLADITENTYDTECPNSNPCGTECASASDEAAETAANDCIPESLSNSCVCDALLGMSAACLSCTLTESSLTEADFQQACGTASGVTPPASSTIPPIVPTTATSSAPAATSTNPLVNCEQSSCSDASDLNYIQLAANCATTDTSCFCTNILALSSSCQSCVLAAIDTTSSAFSQECAASSPTTTSARTPTTTSSAPSATSTNPLVNCEQSSCSDPADLNYIQLAGGCASTDTTCFCTNILALTTNCLDCVLAAIDTTPAAFQSECAAGTSPTPTFVKSTQTPTSTSTRSTMSIPAGTTSHTPSPTGRSSASHGLSFNSAVAVVVLVGTIMTVML